MSKVTRPVPVALPAHGVAFAESLHAADFRMPERIDPFHKLIYVLHGQVVFHDRPGTPEFSAGPGTLLAIERGTAHRLRDRSPATLLLLCLAPRWIADDPPRRTLWRALVQRRSWHLPSAGPASERFENLWRRALLEQGETRPGATVALHALAAQILVTVARQPEVAPAADPAATRVAAVAQELADSFYDEWTLDHAAARAGLSRRHFSELFRIQTGDTFLGTLTRLRLDHAARLLRDGAHSVTGVAFSCGYRDLSHFYRVFRRRFGRPPGRWSKTS
ncbi:MAG: AraC family transcriptional regulator [Verrucomicrobia bacterium]|nr:AraC family transcriptional regulator [Verrucomicrobiota bacterium]